MQHQLISSGSPWEATIGYSRAVRVGNVVEVSGTVAAGDNGVVGKDDPYQQAQFILQKIEKALKDAGASLENVVRTRIYVTNISQWQAVGKAHGEVFSAIRPATTVLEVSKLVNDDYLVEIEATAVI
ncbi:RidA family protein [Beggiatoa leptomitoformis]|uniref:RidA family protein n=1 Tax=Beggiatoa leptomitoformis TaxID=288004 RepID=A0A2N9YEM2_9GAMM|nr:RidA family protein [Beggiatoa leptomitoformis]ALG68725.1 RidA family protein [Beggiatoa leptomitoformis]AUI68920.1 RidA family protein [Beggiatoa leptomitoformis]